MYLEKAMAPLSSTLAWKIPWTEEPGGLQCMGSLWVGHNWETSLSLFTFMHWRRKWHPLHCSFLENPRDRGAWWAAIYGVAQNRTWLSDLAAAAGLCINIYRWERMKTDRQTFPRIEREMWDWELIDFIYSFILFFILTLFIEPGTVLDITGNMVVNNTCKF